MYRNVCIHAVCVNIVRKYLFMQDVYIHESMYVFMYVNTSKYVKYVCTYVRMGKVCIYEVCMYMYPL